MHTEALDYVARFATSKKVAVLDIGGRDLNGTVRHLFPNAAPYRVLDLRPGDGVDIVVDAATWIPDRAYHLVVCCEVFEHAPAWQAICATAYAALRPGGRLVVTCAGPGRAPHSGIQAVPELEPGEHYANIDRLDLLMALRAIGFQEVDVETAGYDTRATAVR